MVTCMIHGLRQATVQASLESRNSAMGDDSGTSLILTSIIQAPPLSGQPKLIMWLTTINFGLDERSLKAVIYQLGDLFIV